MEVANFSAPVVYKRRESPVPFAVVTGRESTLSLGLRLAVCQQLNGQELATDPRPLAKAAEEFERLYGIPISYEDAAYSYDGDVVHRSSPDWEKAHPGEALLIPKGGSVVLRGQIGRSVRNFADAQPLLQALLDDHVRAGNPGEFSIMQAGEGAVVAPVRVRNVAGVLIPDQSPLEVSISFPISQRTALETLQTIFDAILNDSGKKVVVGTTPFIGLSTYAVTIGASNEPARSVLVRMLASLQWPDPRTQAPISKMAWDLFYDPGDRMYALNVHQVRVEGPASDGLKVLKPVAR